MLTVNFGDVCSELTKNNVVIFGAGNYGRRLYRFIKENNITDSLYFCDNDVHKVGTYIDSIPVVSITKACNLSNVKFIIGTSQRNNKNLGPMYNQLINNNVPRKNIFIIDITSIAILSQEEALNNTLDYLNKKNIERKPKERLATVKEIASITFRNEPQNAGVGGPAGVLAVQRMIMGDIYKNYTLTYSFKKENELSLSNTHSLNELLGAIEYAYQLSCEKEDTVYIAHDIFSAYGLYLNGKNYALIYHNQGEAVYEMRNMGAEISEEEESIIKEIELDAIKNADVVSFPSKGAEKFYWSTFIVENMPRYSRGPVLYNTLLEKNQTTVKKISGVEGQECTVTFLSIGQMTKAKGFDRVPGLLVKIQKELDIKIRWIAVANGPLKEAVASDMKKIMDNNKRIDYIQFDRLAHEEINYLFSICDVYMMMHRISIFDFATLEAMWNQKIVVLSDIPGNDEYNKNDNVILIPEDDEGQREKIEILRKSLLVGENENREVYDTFFSNGSFRERYTQVFEQLIGSV